MRLFTDKKPEPAQPQLQSIIAKVLAESAAAANAATKPAKSLIRSLPLRWRVTLGCLGIAATVSAAVIGTLLIYFTLRFPDPLAYRRNAGEPLVRVLARDGSVIAERGGVPAYVPFELIPERITNAVLATEDRRFWSHWGLDPAGLSRAVIANFKAGRITEGGSTLTQQLAKNMFLTSERTFGRKAQELVMALWLELRLSKAEILELYLNRVYFGSGAYGVEAAARKYFDKSASELTLAEAAVIAGLLKAPSRYAPSSNPVQAIERGRSVISKMRAAGLVTPEEEAKALADTVRFSDGGKAERAGTGYVVDAVLEQVQRLGLSEGGDIVIDTTIEPGIQRLASASLQRAIEKDGSMAAVSQGAAVVLDTDGGIRGLVGGASYDASQYNRALKAKRQPGSSFKPFVYLAALEKGLTPQSLVYDLPLEVGGWTPKNDNGKYQGAITLAEALAQSVNTVAARLLIDAGATKVAAVARRLGIQSDLRKDASLALGASEVTMLELAGAYVPFANGGHVVEPYLVRRIRLASGRVLYTREAPAPKQVLAAAHVSEMNAMLNGAVAHGTGKRARLDKWQAAGKTGTSQDFRDAWFVGYTSALVAAVWLGNDDGQPTNRVMGGGLPATIWREIMSAAHGSKTPAPLPGLLPDAPPAAVTASSQGAKAWLPSSAAASTVPPATATAQAHPSRAAETAQQTELTRRFFALMPPAQLNVQRPVPHATQPRVPAQMQARAAPRKPSPGAPPAQAGAGSVWAGTLVAEDRGIGARGPEAVQERIIVLPPEGFMTLGGPLQ